MTGGSALMRSTGIDLGRATCRIGRAGSSLVEVIIAVAILGVGIAGVASVTASSARLLMRARALDETHTLLQSFVDSTSATAVMGVESGTTTHATGVLTWSVPRTPGAGAWARFEHVLLSSPVQIDFVVPVAPGTP